MRGRSILRYPLICGLLLSCGEGPSSEVDGDTDSAADVLMGCETGESKSCDCADGLTGSMTCVDGAFGECECEPVDNGISEACERISAVVSAAGGRQFRCFSESDYIDGVLLNIDAEASDLECALVVTDGRVVLAEDVEFRNGYELVLRDRIPVEWCYLGNDDYNRGVDAPCWSGSHCAEGLICSESRGGVCMARGVEGDACPLYSGATGLVTHFHCEEGFYCSNDQVCTACSTSECLEREAGCLGDLDERVQCVDCLEYHVQNDLCAYEFNRLEDCRADCSGDPNFLDCFQNNCANLSNNYDDCEQAAQATAMDLCLLE